MNLEEMEGRFTAQMTHIQESLQLASQERDELKQRVITLEQEKSELLVNLSNLQTECTKLKSKLSNVKKDCDSYIAALQEEVVSSSA